MKKIFIAAAMMVATISINAQSHVYVFSHDFEDISKTLNNVDGFKIVWEQFLNCYFATRLSDEVDDCTKQQLMQAIGDYDYKRIVAIIKAINEKYPGLFDYLDYFYE